MFGKKLNPSDAITATQVTFDNYAKSASAYCGNPTEKGFDVMRMWQGQYRGKLEELKKAAGKDAAAKEKINYFQGEDEKIRGQLREAMNKAGAEKEGG